MFDFFNLQFLIFILVGFGAQIIDGAFGMAFGIISTSSILAMGASPAIASAATHAAEIVTTGLSGGSHIWHRNINWKLFLKLAITGIIGGVLGAYVLTEIPGEIMKPFVTIYLALMACIIFLRIVGYKLESWKPPSKLVGIMGGFLDASGGGGWGPLVSSTLIARGDHPRKTIGSVNLAEFFITTCVSVTFLMQIDISQYMHIIVGLIIGGALAAPLAGFILRICPSRIALIMIGCILVVLTIINFIKLFIGE